MDYYEAKNKKNMNERIEQARIKSRESSWDWEDVECEFGYEDAPIKATVVVGRERDCYGCRTGNVEFPFAYVSGEGIEGEASHIEMTPEEFEEWFGFEIDQIT